MVGLIEKLSGITTSFFKNENDLIYVLGEDKEEMGGSEYVKLEFNKVAGDSPTIDLNIEKKLHDTLLKLIDDGLINSAHDISEGGIISAIAECCIINESNLIGADVKVPVNSREDFSLFSESQSRIIISISPDKKSEVEKLLRDANQHFTLLGKTGGKYFKVNGKINLELTKIADLYYNSISAIMNV
jgi:phosphoribosylformylglycinamidine synthase